MTCEKYEVCPFFNRISKASGMSATYQANFCRGQFTRCARYVVFKVCGSVPEDLYPNMHDKATEICSKFRASE